jgi:hypothetical protein
MHTLNNKKLLFISKSKYNLFSFLYVGCEFIFVFSI